ncbi:MAG: hypothetical protein IPO01_18135 [Chitinophagaceae bacterium]|nr:hypothetical protein [Chitinophagaceae bacterium]
MKKTAIFCLVFLIACSHPKSDTNYSYVVSSFYKSADTNMPPRPPMPVYGPTNFIVDTAGQIFFYQLQIPRPACTVIDDYSAPAFMHLNPQSIIQVPVLNIADFIKINASYWDNWGTHSKYITIASTVDTVKSLSFKSLIDILSDTTLHVHYSIRMTTQEENIVLDHKKKHKDYSSSSIKWDSTRIRFPYYRIDYSE